DKGGHLQHDLFRNLLNASGKVQFVLGQLGLRLARRSSEQTFEGWIGHPERVGIAEEILIESQASIFADVNELFLDHRNVFRLAVGREAHDLVLPAIDLETCVISKSAVEQAKAVRETEFFQQRDLPASPKADRTSRPLSHTVHCQDGRLFEGRWVEG